MSRPPAGSIARIETFISSTHSFLLLPLSLSSSSSSSSFPLLLLLPLLMDLVSSREHLCYVRCAYCNTVLAFKGKLLRPDKKSEIQTYTEQYHGALDDVVGVPCKRLMDTVTVKCGHCNHLSFLNPRRLLQAHYSDHQLGFQDPCNDCRKGQLSAASSSTSMEQAPKAPFVVKPPEKKHRLPSAYNRFMREEIQRIKAAKPDIPHREAFSTAAKNWAKCDPRGVNPLNSTSDNNEAMKSIMFQHERGNGFTVEAFDVFKQMERQN